MNRIFSHLDFVLEHLDDILVSSRSAEQHAEHLKQVLQLLRTEKLYAKLSKCSFFQPSLKFLGYVVSAEGIHVNSEKVDAIANSPQPKSPTHIRSFLSLSNYFKRFIQGYAKLTAPLVQLTRKSVPFVWGLRQDKAFKQLKHCLGNAPVLAMPEAGAPYAVVCDAAGFGLGAVLLQNQKPIAFHSYKLCDAEQR